MGGRRAVSALTWLLLASAAMGQEWGDPKFLPPDDTTGIAFEYDTEFEGGIIVRLDENIAPVIAKINYAGTTQPTSASVSGLQEVYEFSDELSLWQMRVTAAADYDTMTDPRYTITVNVGTESARVVVSINNLNDNAPQFLNEERTCTFDENLLGDMECVIIVRDQDGSAATTATSITEKDAESTFFSLRAGTLSSDGKDQQYVLTVIQQLDYESAALHSLRISASDADYTTDMSYVVEVNDLPDTPPVWESFVTSITIDEKTSTTVQVTAYDGDLMVNAEISYGVVVEEDEYAEYFQMDTSTGVLTVTPINRDELKQEFFKMVLTAYETDDPSSNVDQSFVVIVNDVNDNIPTITATTTEVQIDEGSTVTLDLGTITIVDPDLADNGQFNIALEENQWSSAFQVVPTSGYQSASVSITVRDASPLDYEDETWRNITLRVVATEMENETHVDTMDFFVYLLDVNDETPVFDQEQYEVNVLESAGMGEVVATVTATDADTGDDITYAVVPSGQFVIDASSGQISVGRANALDYESATQVTLQVSATDEANHRAYVDVVINVQDVNDEAPTVLVDPTSVEVEEESDGIVAATVEATDPDTTANLQVDIDWDSSWATKLGRRLSDNSLYTGSFRIELTSAEEDSGGSVTANLVASGDPLLDWGNLDALYLYVRATDTATDEDYVEANSIRTVQVVISITDINNKAPIFREVGNLSVVEEISDILIGNVVAEDADDTGNNDVRYSIWGAEDLYEGYVGIDETSGDLRTIQNIDGDAEGFEYVNLVVSATDGVHITNQSISIYVVDRNDEVPQFLTDQFETDVSIPERTETGVLVVQVVAADNDRTAPYNTITYLLVTESNDNSLYFAMDNVTGALMVSLTDGKVLRREDVPVFSVTIRARDNFLEGLESDSNYADITVTVTLIDINDNAPVFQTADDVEVDGCFNGEISEYSLQGTILGTVLATDTDAGENSAISYSIVSILSETTGENLEELLFAVDEDSGVVTAAVDLTGLWGTYFVTFNAEDHGTLPLSGTATYTFCVLDENDNDPVFVYPNSDRSTIRLRETQEVGGRLYDPYNQFIPDFSATDADDIENGNGLVDISIVGGATDLFEIEDYEDNTARLLLRRPLNTSEGSRYELTLMAADNGTPKRTANISILVTIVTIEEVEPEFNVTADCILQFTENTTGLQESQTIPEAFDENNENVDEVDKQDIYYFIASGDEVFFNLDPTSRELTLAAMLDHESATSHTIYIVATNSDTEPPNVVITDNESVLQCTVEVIDINDMPPVFAREIFAAGFSVDDEIGKVIFTLVAEDPDVADSITYSLVEGSIGASSPSLDALKENALLVATDGSVSLNFEPKDSNLDGFFTFLARARDSFEGDDTGHFSEVEAQVYVISDVHRVTFQFLNPKEAIDNQIPQMEDIFSDVFGYQCGIESTIQSVDATTGIAVGNSTDVTAHFIDEENQLPVEKDRITQQFYEQETYKQLQTRFWEELGLDLRSYQEAGSGSSNQDIEGLLTIVLIVVSVVLGSMVILLFIAFCLRTRTLNRRLKALSTTKFGSQDSGLNRAGVVVPNTNKHAVEGSNPVWGAPSVIDYDNMSQGSGDSDLIGIEDNPQFQPNKKNAKFMDGPHPPHPRKLTGILNDNFTFHPDDPDADDGMPSRHLSPDFLGKPQPRRLTETMNHNFILQPDEPDDESSIPNDFRGTPTHRVNPLATGAFKTGDSIPVTQL